MEKQRKSSDLRFQWKSVEENRNSMLVNGGDHLGNGKRCRTKKGSGAFEPLEGGRGGGGEYLINQG